MNLLSGKNPIRQLKFQFFEVQCKHLSICHRFFYSYSTDDGRGYLWLFPTSLYLRLCVQGYQQNSRQRTILQRSAIAHPHNQIDGYPLALEYAQHADMCASTRAASAEHERDTGFRLQRQEACLTWQKRNTISTRSGRMGAELSRTLSRVYFRPSSGFLHWMDSTAFGSHIAQPI